MKVLLTGATGGIGAELAAILADSGASLLLTGRSALKLTRLCDRLSDSRGSIEAVAADLATAEGLAAVVAAAERFEGGINVLINNAGVNRFNLFADQHATDIDALMRTNVVAPMLLCRELLPALEAQPASLIVNIGSIVGSIGMPGQVAYASSKFALHGFSESLRRELLGSSTKVLYVAPRSTDTDMNDDSMRRINDVMGVSSDDAARVADVVAAAMVKETRERFVGWPERLFVKINALFPALVDRSLRKQTELLTNATPDTPSPMTASGGSQS